MSNKESKMYFVNYWGSHPSKGNDDCHAGEEFETYDEAYDAFHAPADLPHTPGHVIAFVELTGDDGSAFGSVYLVRRNPSFDRARNEREDAAFERMARSERATQAGMSFGCAGHNDARGW